MPKRRRRGAEFLLPQQLTEEHHRPHRGGTEIGKKSRGKFWAGVVRDVPSAPRTNSEQHKNVFTFEGADALRMCTGIFDDRDLSSCHLHISL